ncbi:dimethylarginine dimethylaminohydrolase family protein [Vagococcus entomophilus]|uniref:Arginine deiminase n=1 Tax=Vagococcus entomophilus TaxID=1160095 RepID=A0A430AFF3_9ENTE|nr:arginine deiminase family protein [Vagococcus entomophilus]RSU06452.1 arginine deiminase [Vagococcus entomophilus]
MKNITVYNEYATLKTVIIGNAETIYIPDAMEMEQEAHTATWKKLLNKYLYKVLKGKKVPQFLAKKYQRELHDFKKILEKNNVEVLTVDPVVPSKKEEPGMAQMYARDSVMCVGNLLIEGNLKLEMRKKEMRGYQSIVQSIKNQSSIHQLHPSETAFLEGGDVLVDYPYVFVGIGKYASNENGINWLQNLLDISQKEQHPDQNWRVIPVYLNDDSLHHLDCCFTIIGPKTAIIHKDSLKALPKELEDYHFIEIDTKTNKEMGGNVLVIGPKKIIVQKRHLSLQKSLQALGYTVFPLDFTWHARLDGAFRCASCPLERIEENHSI